MADSSQAEEVALATKEAHMMVCDWCSGSIKPGEAVQFDGSDWHAGCLGLYQRYKGKPVAEVPPEEFVCPMGGHTHPRNPFTPGGDTRL